MDYSLDEYPAEIEKCDGFAQDFSSFLLQLICTSIKKIAAIKKNCAPQKKFQYLTTDKNGPIKNPIIPPTINSPPMVPVNKPAYLQI
jgi:hypothetical protein